MVVFVFEFDTKIYSCITDLATVQHAVARSQRPLRQLVPEAILIFFSATSCSCSVLIFREADVYQRICVGNFGSNFKHLQVDVLFSTHLFFVLRRDRGW